MSKELKKAVAYLRTSSAANVGADKDSDKRQLAAITAYAKAAGYQVVGVYYDAAVSGADPISERAGFAEMLTRVATNGAKTILLESPDRFARDLAVQLAGHDMLKSMGIDIIPASSPDFFISDTPTAVLVRQVLGAISEFEKASIVAKLAAARKRKKAAQGKCEGRKSFAEASPELVQMVKALRGNGRGPSLRAISAQLASEGYLNERGMPFNPKSISVILKSKVKNIGLTRGHPAVA